MREDSAAVGDASRRGKFDGASRRAQSPEIPDLTSRSADRCLGRHRSAVVDTTIAAQCDPGYRRADGAGVGYSMKGTARYAGRLDTDLALGTEGAAIFDPAIRRQCNFANGGADIAGVAHADSCLRAHQEDLVGIHTAQLRHIDAERRRGILRGDGRDLGVIRIDPVGPGGHMQFLSPDAGIHFNGARDDLGIVGLRVAHAGALHPDAAAADHIPLQIAAIHDDFARGERSARRIDEAATVAGHPRRVRDDDLGTVACYFHESTQIARIAGIDFIENHPRRAVRQVWIALDPAAQLGLHIRAGVVQDGAVALDVELAVCIARYAGSAGGLDVDLGDPVRGVHHHRLLAARGSRVCHDLRLRAWHHDHRGADQRQHGQADPAQARHRLRDDAFTCGTLRRYSGAIANGFSNGHQHAASFVEDDAIAQLVHVLLSFRLAAARPRSVGPHQIETRGHAGGLESVRFGNRSTGEGFIGDTSQRAPQSQHGAS